MGVFHVGEVFKPEGPLGLGNAACGKGCAAGLLVDHVVGVQVLALLLLFVDGGVYDLLEPRHKIVRLAVEVGALVTLAGDDERGTGLIDEDGVHLVDDGEGMAALDHVAFIQGHVVAQVVKAHLVVGAVSDVAVVGLAALVVCKAVDDEAHGEAEEAVNLAHPLAVAAGKIIVDRDDMYALAGQRVEVGGQHGDEGLAFAGLHLGDTALVQHNAADELNAEGAHAQYAPARLSRDREGLGQQIVQRLAVLESLLKLVRLGSKLLVRQGGHFVGQRFDLVRDGVDAL